MAFSLQARVVFPVDRPPIENGIVTIDGDRIVGVEPKKAGCELGEIIDLGNVALLPGLVNAHTHLEFSSLRRPLGVPGIGIVDWIRLVIAERGRTSSDDLDAFDSGGQESLRAGVTTAGDVTTRVPTLPPELRDLTLFHEVIGFSRARAESALNALVERIDAAQRTLAATGVGDSARVRHGISPHAPYTVSPKLVAELVMLARSRQMPMAMHLAESREELQFLDSGTGPFHELLDERSMWDAEAVPRGSRPLDYLRMLADAPRSLVVHGNYLVDDELAFVGANRERMSLVYCPRTHSFFSHEPYPLANALAAEVRVALGTDSRASNPDLDLLADVRYLARLHSAIDPHEVLRMATLAGAEALGRDKDVGSITPGKIANLVAVPLPEHAQGPSDALAAILTSDLPASSVWLRGNRWRSNPTTDAN